MTEEKELSPEQPMELIDLGDAVLETKQQSPSFVFPDCAFNYGTKYGC